MQDTYAEAIQRAAEKMAVTLMELQGDIHTLHDASVNEYENEPGSYAVNEALLGHNLGSLSVGPRTTGTQALIALALAEDTLWQLSAAAWKFVHNPPQVCNDHVVILSED